MVYEGDRLSKRHCAELSMKLIAAFPMMSEAKVRLLLEMMLDDEFTDVRAADAVKHVIKSHIAWGQEPPIGAFIQFDRRVKVFTYGEMCAKYDRGEIPSVPGPDYEPIDVGLEKPRWAKREDVQQYNLTKWMVKQQQQGGRL